MPEKLEFDRKQLVLRVQAGLLGDYRHAGSSRVELAVLAVQAFRLGSLSMGC